ncbi:adenylate cyclase [Flavobacterium branchiophilum]|uniref:CYTH domain-containing protein n=1 Tax=Flavobacterium branchiophilum TaxID=55197 RepID=A0A543G3M6_9FLAO|nr:CYTH domain-containing protein [Flavobacterium branchiophilum]OXA77633.1 adenylate cyclase [Flavobacterium branchiophilum] [Flavobacterium branchiophilum NBRC 15030 = ATCC 35035]TQM40681.1 CYTH domain-containing protein [Flavobacterium branchiophilum]GEM54240.1 CYTH domain-containing protein [Flavobacterium branchiophilum NBRC 15030 = ATCC 35035]
MLEIERKFKVTSNDFKTAASTSNEIAQGYLNDHPDRTVRVRIKGAKAFLTIKGKSNAAGTTRFEWEKEIPVHEAQDLLLLCEKGVIQKKRYEVSIGQHVFEVDEFFGDNQGLIIAEIELTTENEVFEKPLWLGTEVTGDERYYNAYLSQNPFVMWEK